MFGYRSNGKLFLSFGLTDQFRLIIILDIAKQIYDHRMLTK